MADNNEMQLVQQGAEMVGKAGGAISDGAGGFFKGLLGAPWAAVTGAFNTALRGSLWVGGAVGLAAVTGLLHPALKLVGQEKLAEKLGNTLAPENGGLPKFLIACLGTGAALTGTYGAVRGAVGSVTGSTDATPEGTGMGIGGTLAVVGGTVALCKVIMDYANDDQPGDSKTPAATPVKTADNRTNTAAL